MSGLLKAAQRLVNHLKSSSLVLGRSTYFITVVQVGLVIRKKRQRSVAVDIFAISAIMEVSGCEKNRKAEALYMHMPINE